MDKKKNHLLQSDWVSSAVLVLVSGMNGQTDVCSGCEHELQPLPLLGSRDPSCLTQGGGAALWEQLLWGKTLCPAAAPLHRSLLVPWFDVDVECSVLCGSCFDVWQSHAHKQLLWFQVPHYCLSCLPFTPPTPSYVHPLSILRLRPNSNVLIYLYCLNCLRFSY